MHSQLEVAGGPLSEWLFNLIGLKFEVENRSDIRPGDRIASIANKGRGLQQMDAAWGIRPSWAATQISYVEAETVADKDLYADAFERRRCVVPCSAWHSVEAAGSDNQCYRFSSEEDPGVLLAGIWFPAEQGNDLLVLSTRSTAMYAEYQSRMPLLLPPTKLRDWIDALPEQLEALMQPPVDLGIRAEACNRQNVESG